MASEQNAGTFALLHRKKHTRQEWLRKFQQCGSCCHYCEKPLTIDTATKDHQTPTCRGGSDAIDNIVPACLDCNQRKAWRTEQEFLAVRYSLSTNMRGVGGIGNPKSRPSLDERLNEPGMLKKVIHERERISWAWRHPA
jgi:hypothetical protein